MLFVYVNQKFVNNWHNTVVIIKLVDKHCGFKILNNVYVQYMKYEVIEKNTKLVNSSNKKNKRWPHVLKIKFWKWLLCHSNKSKNS